MASRERSQFTATIADNGTKTDAINAAGMASGSVYLPTGFVGVTLTFEVSDAYGGTYVVRCRSGEILAIMLGGILLPPMANLMTGDQLELVGEREEY